jgi:hypothetical protein
LHLPEIWQVDWSRLRLIMVIQPAPADGLESSYAPEQFGGEARFEGIMIHEGFGRRVAGRKRFQSGIN